MPGKIVARGIKWNSNRIKKVPENLPGVFVVFDEEHKRAKIRHHFDIQVGLREEWWKKNFWYFHWFATNPSDFRAELAAKLNEMNYDELLGLTKEKVSFLNRTQNG